MSEQLRMRVLAYLAAHHVVTLATQGVEGVWGTAVFYVNDGFNLYFLSAPHTRHSQNIAQNSRVAATIQEDYQEWTAIKGIQLEGHCTLLAGDEREAAINRYATKFPIIGDDAPPQIAQAMSKIGWYKIVPTRLYFIDNALGLGHRDEVEL
ncbi:MAG: pyridoxamine 5'-phosphate oxidase family protein [Ardenticatenaceae bacterium]|nr:pyridoxamine 5'-phosphate oxidase family protein [Ardenticatenaceae bacterium]